MGLKRRSLYPNPDSKRTRWTQPSSRQQAVRGQSQQGTFPEQPQRGQKQSFGGGERETDKSQGYVVRVTGLTSQATMQDLYTNFSRVGEVKSVSIQNKNGKLVGNVTYYSQKNQRRATQSLHEFLLHGKRLNVTLHTERPEELIDLFISGHPPNKTNEELRQLLEEACDIPCVRVTNKGAYCFFQVEGRANFEKALKSLDGAVMSTGHKLSCQPSRRKTRNCLENTKLARIMTSVAASSNIIPSLNEADMHTFERSVRTVHVSPLCKDITKEELSACFEQWGEIEDINIVQKPEYTTIYAFVAFKDHSSMHKIRESHKRNIVIRGTNARFSTSKPTKTITETAVFAGLLDIDMNPTKLFFTLLEVSMQQLQQSEGVMPTGQVPKQSDIVYFQDPTTGELYACTQADYIKYITQNYQMQQVAQSQMQQVAQSQIQQAVHTQQQLQQQYAHTNQQWAQWY